MARTVRDTAIGTREGRLKLKPGYRYWRGIHGGLALGYRRRKQGSGSWTARLRLANGKYALRRLGDADDHGNADDARVLNFKQAQQRALVVQDQVNCSQQINCAVTVRHAAEMYLVWFKENRKSISETKHAINAHIVPKLGERLLSELKAHELRLWLEDVAAQPARLRPSRVGTVRKFKPTPKTEDAKRARRATANRILSVLKAILNRAFQIGLAIDDSEWRKVVPFRKVDEARIRFLSDTECSRLLRSCPPDLMMLVRAALLTGARFGELKALEVRDVDLLGCRLYISPSKSARARYIPLNSEGSELFQGLLATRAGSDLVLTRANGKAWGKNHYSRPLRAASEAANIAPPVRFHELRHCYGSSLAQAGVGLLAIAKLLGHASPRVTAKHYAHIADGTLAAAVTRLPAFNSRAHLV